MARNLIVVICDHRQRAQYVSELRPLRLQHETSGAQSRARRNRALIRFTSKVSVRGADKSGMDKNNPPKLDRDDPNWDVSQAVEMSVRAIRKVRGLKNPEDCVQDTAEYERVVQAFLLDVLVALDEQDNGLNG